MTQDQWTHRLSEFVDGDLPAGEHAALTAHLAGCAACRDTVAQLERVVARAQALEDRPPTTDLWSGIASRIGLSTGAAVVNLAEHRARRRLVFSLPQALAAGIALMVLSAGAVAVALRPRAVTPEPTPVAVQPPAAGGGTVRAVRFPESVTTTYDAAVVDLQKALAADRSRLDTATVRVIEQNLAIIDRAIAQARAALAADPANTYLNLHLADTMRRKLELLRQANAIATTRS